jgi:hypothetical protein
MKEATFKRPFIALAVAAVLAAGCSDLTLPGVRDARAVPVQPSTAAAAASSRDPRW